VPRTVVRLSREEVFYFDPNRLVSVLESPTRMARDIHELLKIITAISAIRGLIALQTPLLELILEFIPAERAALVLLDNSGEELGSIFACDTLHNSCRVPICQQIAEQVLHEGVGLLSNDAIDRKKKTEHALMAAPLVVYDRILGFIYLDTQNKSARFDEGHLHVLVTVAVIAAIAIENARHLEHLQGENERLRSEISLEHAMVGDSVRMRELYQFISKVAHTDTTVLLLGESGTGKELAARAIHQNSQRAREPFVAINCAAITETLLESELFGYEKGAFTGAAAQTKGKLEVAEGGTVFLDEIGELVPTLQSKLLRVLQEHEFTRVGGTRLIKLRARLIAATNRNLEEAVRQGRFRQDLYYRLNVVSKRLPSLRERRQDIPLLAKHFVQKYSAKVGRRVTGISEQAEVCLLSYNWPGNIRELENAIEHGIVLGSNEQLLIEDLPDSLLESAPSGTATCGKFHAAVREAKRQAILTAIAHAQGNYTKAARDLGLNANYLHRLLHSLDLVS
jgi:transcriptional regulator with GAF, ATPase, and Fis domain